MYRTAGMRSVEEDRVASLADVAQAAGVSKSTASRALIHPQMVAAATRERILRIATELGFRPNRAARALSGGRTGLVCLVVPTLSNPFFAPIVLGAQQSAEDSDQHILVIASEYSAEREARQVNRLMDEVDGFIMVAPQGNDVFLRKLAKAKPLVLVDRTVGRLPALTIDTPGGVAQIADHFIGLGNHRIGYVGGPRGSRTDQLRRAALRERAEAGRVRLIEFGPVEPTVDAGIEVSPAVVAARITAVIGYNSSTVLGLLNGFAAAGVRVPADVSVASADDFIMFSSSSPPVTVLEVPVRDTGHAAMDWLTGLLAGEQPGRPVTIATTMLIRESTKRRRRATGR
jgi:LacI family transcriptional regulator